MNITILRFDTIDSTNTEAANQARQGADEGLCVIAREQSAGRGRHGRTWVSELDAGIYFSIVLRPRIELKFLPTITLMSGVAVYDALKDWGLMPDIKWVNDVLIGEKKVAGILAETVETPTGIAVVVGIGINVTGGNIPHEITETAASILSEPGAVATGLQREAWEVSLTSFLNYWYEILNSKGGPAEVVQNWQSRSSYYSGKAVRVTLPDRVLEGTTDGLEENGALRVKTPDGSVTIVQAGDVERLRSQ